MPTASWFQDRDIHEAGALSALWRGVTGLGRAMAAAGTILYSGGNLTGAVPSYLSGIGFPLAAGMVGAGHFLKGLSSLTSGHKERGIKEMLRGAAESGYVYVLGTYVLKAGAAALFSAPALLVLAAEPISWLMTGKTLTANIGEIAANVIDGVADLFRPSRQRQPIFARTPLGEAVQPALMQGANMNLAPAAGMAAVQAPPAQRVAYLPPAQAAPVMTLGTSPAPVPQNVAAWGMLPGAGGVTAATPAAVGTPVFGRRYPATMTADQFGGVQGMPTSFVQMEERRRQRYPAVQPEALAQQ